MTNICANMLNSENWVYQKNKYETQKKIFIKTIQSDTESGHSSIFILIKAKLIRRYILCIWPNKPDRNDFENKVDVLQKSIKSFGGRVLDARELTSQAFHFNTNK